MSSSWRRFEVLLPIKFNDGREIPNEWLGEAVLEIAEHFGAASFETQTVEGHWRYGGVIHRDELARVVVDIADTDENRAWMKAYKARWKARLEQIELGSLATASKSNDIHHRRFVSIDGSR